jgi:phosphatidylcholine synthase
MTPRLNALAVHLLTASGAVLAMFAMLAAVKEEWSLMFLWLVVALIVDGVDGPLARKYDVQKNWPTYDGVLMDLIVDYLTYVFIPAFALFQSGLLPGWTGWLAIIVICFGSVVYFADTRMKTSQTVILLVVIFLTAAMFTNLKFIHPVRTGRWNQISLAVTVAWIALAAWAAWWDFQEGPVAKWLLVLASLYLMLAGIVQQIVPEGIRRVR